VDQIAEEVLNFKRQKSFPFQRSISAGKDLLHVDFSVYIYAISIALLSPECTDVQLFY
jgi:hypothetical protein